jgi:hypothetical protein
MAGHRDAGVRLGARLADFVQADKIQKASGSASASCSGSEQPMRKFLAAVAVIAVSAGLAAAHPAKAISITITGNRVDITVEHQTMDPKRHYIREIEVSVNGKKLVHQDFAFQTDAKTQLASYIIPEIIPGAVVAVMADCNKGGKLAVEKKAQ